MKLSGQAAVLAALLLLLLLLTLAAVAEAGVACGQYEFMAFEVAANISSSCESPNSFKAASTGGSGYVALYSGCHWGLCSPDTTLPRLVSELGNISTSFASSMSSDAAHYDQTYDIWFDELRSPNGRNARYELMIWTQYVANQPLAKYYDAHSQAVPTLTDVSVAGLTWDFFYANPGGGGESGPTYSFLRKPMSSKVSFKVRDFSDWLIGNKYMPSGLYCTSVQAGWEFSTLGKFDASHFSVTQNTASVCDVDNGGCGPASTTTCDEMSGQAVCTCASGYAGNPPAAPCVSNGGKCPIVVKDGGAGTWWMPYTVYTTVPGRVVTQVKIKGLTTAFNGPYNWGDGPTMFTFNPPQGGNGQFIMLVTDNSSTVYPVKIAGFDAAFAYSC